MKNIKKILLALTLLALVIFLKNHFSAVPLLSQKNLPVVAITQIVEHASLDQEREGILCALKERGYVDGKTVKVIYQNAQGNMATSAQLTTQLMSQNPTVMVAISTPSAQAALVPCQNQKVPLVFTAVTDPVEAKLVKGTKEVLEDFDITGVCDSLPAASQIEMIGSFISNFKRLGIIYNAGEINSVAMVNALKEAALKNNVLVVESTALKTSDVSAATANLVGKVDAIYVPNDNTAVASISSIVKIAEKHKIPVFAGDVGSVMNGAVATQGYDRHQLGMKAGQIVCDILEGKKASSIAVAKDHLLTLYVNKEAAQKSGVSLPTHVLSTATFVGD
jgi:putative ABC transport system substrate-binding protein